MIGCGAIDWHIYKDEPAWIQIGFCILKHFMRFFEMLKDFTHYYAVKTYSAGHSCCVLNFKIDLIGKAYLSQSFIGLI